MKKIYFIFSALLLAMMTSCSSSGSKEITPTSTEFPYGELAKYIEVVDQPSELTIDEEDDGAILRLKVTLQMTKDGIKNVDARNISFRAVSSIANINLVDENGNTVITLDLRGEDKMKVKKLLTGSKGDTEEIIFETQYHDDVRKWFEQASQFTPSRTVDIFLKNTF